MVAVVAGHGLGLFNTSLNTLGGAGVIGQGRLGVFGGQSYVNAVNGNLILRAQDEQLSGRGFDLGHLRTYNAQGQLNDGDGDGWRWDGERKVVLSGTRNTTGSTLTRTGGDGSETVYRWDGTRYIGTDGNGAHDSLSFQAAAGGAPEQWLWTDGSSQWTERYSVATGRLTSQTDTSGNQISFEYDANGRLSSVTDVGSGQKLVLTYAPAVTGSSLIRLQKVDTYSLNLSANPPTLGAAVRQVEYGYDTTGRLTSVKTDLTPQNTTDSQFYITGYTYDGTSSRIASVTQGDGTSAGVAMASFTYEQIGTTGVYRVKTVSDSSGTQTFDYAVAGQTKVTDANGQDWFYVYDSSKRLTEIRMPAPASGGAVSTTRFEYDSNDNVTKVTDALNKATVYTYDSNGNRILERDALGNTVTRTYDAQNRLLTETRYRTPDPDGAGAGLPGEPETVRYVYDAQSRLRFVVTAEGRVSENRYTTGSYGLLERSLQYTSKRYDVSALGQTAALSETQLTTWLSTLSTGDKQQSQLTQYVYDYRGNLSKRTDFATVNTAGDGVLDAGATVTESVYDGHGQRLQTIAVRGSARDQRTTLTSSVYDGMGRELQVINASGTRTTVYDDANRRITVTNGSGLSTVQAYDAYGRLLSVTQSASGANRVTQYVYDAAGRLRMQVSAGANATEASDDLRYYSFYDNQGRLQYQVDSTGAVTGMRYDANGRLLQRTQYANRANPSSWYANDTVTKATLTVGAAGSDVLADASLDRVTGYTYDDAGRLKTEVDAANTTTTTTYDGASRVVQKQTGDRVTRYFYDRDGRQVGMVDPLGYLTEFKYDAAGRLVETIRYTTPSPQRSNTGAPVWLGVTNQTVVGNRPFEVRLPAAYDPDGDTVVYSVVGTLPAGVTFDAASVSLRGTLPATLTSYDITLRASDNRGNTPRTTDVTVRLTVANSAPVWSGVSDRIVAVNTSNVSIVLPLATDLNSTPAQLVYSIPAGLLPPGMTFNAATRTLSGTPTAAGSFSITARVTDQQGAYTEQTFTIAVTNTGPSWASAPPQVGRVNTTFDYTVPAATDPEGQALTYAAVSLPPGLSFDAATRRLTGRPTVAGPQAVVLRATDPNGDAVLLVFSVDVKNDAPYGYRWGDGGVAYLLDAQAGIFFAQTPSAPIDPEGQALTYTLVGGSLPAGMSVDSTNGRIFGTPSPTGAGTYTWTVRASDPHGASVTQVQSMRVLNSPPYLTGGPASVAFEEGSEVGFSPFEFDLRSWIGDINGQTLTYSIDNRPYWLFGSGPALYGTAPAVGGSGQSWTMTITATDPYGQSVTTTITVSVYNSGGGGGGGGQVPIIGPGPQPAASSPAKPAVTALAALPPIVDVLAGVRPTDIAGLRSYQYYDGQGRVVGAVDDRGFLSESVYDAHNNRQQSLRYATALTVDAAADTLTTLRSRAGTNQSTTVTYDGFGRISTQTGVDGSLSRTIYDSAGRVARQVWAEGTAEQRASRTRYNAFDEVTGTVGGVGEATLVEGPTQTQLDTAIAGYGMRYEYDSFGRRVKAIDANDKPSWFYYDSEGRLSHTVNALGEVSETLYNRFGQAETMRRYATRLTSANLAAMTGGFASTAFLERLVASTDDQLTEYRYDDPRGLMTRQTVKRNNRSADDTVTTSTYTQYGQLATQTRTIAAGRSTTTQFGYSLRGELLAQTGDVGGINLNSQRSYDAYGRVIQSIDGAGKITKTDYNDSGRTIVVTDPLNRTMRSEYDAYGRVFKQVDGLGQTTTYSYDHLTRSASITTPEGITLTTRRNRHGETVEAVDGRGNTTIYDYDKNGQVLKVTDALGRVVSDNTYDNSGRLITTRDARGTVTNISYDAVNRVYERQVDAAGLNIKTRYLLNGLGQAYQVIDGLGSSAQRTTAYVYDRKGQLAQTVVDPNGLKLSTRYTFDGLGNTVLVEQGTFASPAQQVTRHEFDNLGRRIKTIAAPSSVFGASATQARDLTTEYRYDAAGRMSRSIDALGQSTWFVYDAAGQLTQTVNAMGEVVETQYDDNGRAVQTRRYLNRASQAMLDGFGDSIGTVNVAVSSKDQRSYRAYDKDGRQRYQLVAAAGGDWTIAESRYDANGNVIETRRYDKYLPETRIDALAPGGITSDEIRTELTKPVADGGLGYVDDNAVSNSKTQRTRFAYDANNRLRFSVDALGSVSETVYDNAGNVLSQIRYAARPTLTAYTESAIGAAVNRASADNRIGQFAYDAAGRLRYSVQVLVSDTTGKATQHLVSRQDYDALGRVVLSTAYATVVGEVSDYTAATLDAAVTVSTADRRSAMVYDLAGRQVYSVRISAIGTNGIATQHLVSKNDYDALGRVVRSTAYATPVNALGAYTLTAVSAAVAASAQDRSTEFVYDAAGRQRFVIAADGGLSETLYDAFGRVRESRQFAFTVDKATAWTEATLATRRAGRTVGDGITRGERYTYDRANRVLTTTDAKGHVETFEYNGLGDKTTYTNKNGAKWAYTYDRLGRVTLQETPKLRYQLSNESAPPTTDRSLTTLLQYNAFGNLTSRREAYGTVDERRTDFEYDRLGRQTLTTEPGWYDPATGRVERTNATGRFQRTTEVSYDPLGNTVRNTMRTGAGKNDFIYQYKTYDVLGRLVHEIDALNNVTTMSYTTFGEQRTVTRQSVTIGGTLPASGYWGLADIAAKLAGDAAARTITTTYDNLGRMLEVTQPTAGSYYYSGNSAAVNAGSITATSAAATTRYEYNAFGQLHRQSIQIDANRWNESWRYYDVMGRETRSIDALGHHATRSYDALGNLAETVEYATAGAAGSSGNFVPPAIPAENGNDRITAFLYDARNQQIEVQRKNLRYTQWTGSAYQQVNNARDATTTVQRITYDGVGNVRTQTDALGNLVSTEYDALSHVIQVTEPARTTAAAGSIDPFRSQVTATPVTTLTMDAFGRVVKQTRSAGGGSGETTSIAQSYDVAGNLTGTTDANGNVKNRQYDYAGRVIKETQAINVALGGWQTVTHTLERRYAYDTTGRQIAALTVYMEGGVAQQTGQRSLYNAFGEVTEERQVWGLASTALGALNSARVAVYTYSNAGQIETRQAVDGQTRYYYNLTGQVTRQEQRGNNDTADGTVTRITETGYDLLGRAVIMRLPVFGALYTYSGNRTDAITPVTEQTYDRWGNVASRSQGGYVFNASGQLQFNEHVATRYEYNADNQVIVERLPTHSAIDRSDRMYDANVGHELRYDLLGRVVQERDVVDDAGTAAIEQTELRLRSRQYNGAGQVVSEIDATGILTEYAYDAHGNRVGTRNALGTVFVDAFDKNGNLTSRSVLRQRISAGLYGAYDSRNMAQTPVAVKLNEYGYDQANRRVLSTELSRIAGVDDRNQYTSFTQYDERNQVRATRNAAGLTTTYAYDAFGNKTRAQTGTGTLQSWTYGTTDYTTGQLQNSQLQSSVSGAVVNRTTGYGYNDFGQIKTETYDGQSGSRTYAYHGNGLLRQMVDVSARGTRGSAGGADYWSATETTGYEYSAKGERQKESFSRTGEQDVRVYDYELRRYVYDTTALAPLSRTIRTVYDRLGRVGTVHAPAAENTDGGGQLATLNYRYDELGNRRSIYAIYSTATGSRTSNKWYTYDQEGRMTGVDIDPASVDSGTYLRYDAVGRRAEATTYRTYEAGLPPQQYRDRTSMLYGYNDLGMLTQIQKVTEDGRTGAVSAPSNVLSQGYNDRGQLLTQQAWDETSGVLKTFTTTTYLADGRLVSQVIDAYTAGVRDAKLSSESTNYDYADDGRLRSYVYTQGATTNDAFSNTYGYSYSAQFGGDKEQRITVTSTQANSRASTTENQYDGRGRLMKQEIETSEGLRRQTFSYDGEGHILTKQEVRTGNGAASSGRQDYFYAGGNEVAAIGAGTLFNTTRFSSGYTPISRSYPAAVPGSYVVNNGDTLAGIARTVFGDSALWYLIADANNLSYGPGDVLPPVEQGKSYRIPNVVANLHNNANTFQPYNPAAIIGDSTPTPSLIPAAQCNQTAALLADMVITAISISMQLAVTATLTAVGVPAPIAGAAGGAVGGASGNALRQGVANVSGQQDGFDLGQLGDATVQGAIAGLVSGAVPSGSGILSRTATQVFSQNFGQMAGEYVTGRSSSFTWTNFAINAGAALLGNGLNAIPSGRPNALSLGVNDQARSAITTAAAATARSVMGEKVDFAAAASGYIGGLAGDYFGNRLGNAIANAIVPPKPAVEIFVPRVPTALELMQSGLGPISVELDPTYGSVSPPPELEFLPPTIVDNEAIVAAMAEEYAYTVEKGDTLNAIAARLYGNDYAYLGSAVGAYNGIDPLALRQGQDIKAPLLDDIDLGKASALAKDEYRRENGTIISARWRAEFAGNASEETGRFFRNIFRTGLERAKQEQVAAENGVLTLDPRLLADTVLADDPAVVSALKRAAIDEANNRLELQNPFAIKLSGTSATALNYEEGPPRRPNIRHDNGFLAEPVGEDETFAAAYEVRKRLGTLVGNISFLDTIAPGGIGFKESTTAVLHYLNGRGEDWEFDATGYFQDDDAGQRALNYLRNDMRNAAKALYANKLDQDASLAGQNASFSLTSTTALASRSASTNWKFAIGRSLIWSSADVNVVADRDGNFVFSSDLTLHIDDRFNANPRQSFEETLGFDQDVQLGVLEKFGLAHQFNAYGTYVVRDIWKESRSLSYAPGLRSQGTRTLPFESSVSVE